MITIDERKIYEDSNGLWVSGLFGSISGNYPGISFEQQKEVFFWLVHKWLKSGLIAFCDPDTPLDKPWKADADVVVNYLRNLWPTSAIDENDEDLLIYFHEIPALLWIEKDGNFYGS